ncbi:hypothetical protein [Polyangium sp. 15x6]|uniref:hypothetical protein n=1 Tax=Polyangium sp. 15x6 TaxID=3042687 RepID=UPI00249C415B|nr:hypothetical protein [Polyangium sp. 15x6]MDI3284143.1 hypothetical protein [Polyangium sp. 15x6]
MKPTTARPIRVSARLLCGAAWIVLSSGCLRGQPPPEEPSRWADLPPRVLTLGIPARGDTRQPDRQNSYACARTFRSGQFLDNDYGFQVREAASYRFELVPDFLGSVVVQERDEAKAGWLARGCASAYRGHTAVLSLPLEPGLYRVVVDAGDLDEAGRYVVRVDRDTSASAVLRPEDPAKVASLCASGRALGLGGRALGTFSSLSGGARAACGLTGGNAVHRLSLEAPARVRLRAAAHFPLAIEIRDRCAGPSVACARAPEGAYEVELVAELEAGEHYVILDATHLSPLDVYNGPRVGAGVLGAYVLDAEEVPR